MITRKEVIAEVKKIPEQYLFDLYKIIKDFEVKKENGIREALSFDTDFEQAGFKLLLPQT